MASTMGPAPKSWDQGPRITEARPKGTGPMGPGPNGQDQMDMGLRMVRTKVVRTKRPGPRDDHRDR